ncbi:MAG: peptidylprolyl isomerase, partial [Bacteroidota bacterium]
AYMARGMRRVLMDSLRARHTGQVQEIRVREISVSTIEEAEALLERLTSGESFEELARLHSTRRSSKNGGATGFLLAPLYHEAAGSLPIGEVFGPLPANDGFLITEILERRSAADQVAALEQVLEEELMRYVARLATNERARIDLESLESVPVLPLNMMQVRFLGFNNRLLAAPTLQKMIEWFDYVDREALYREL